MPQFIKSMIGISAGVCFCAAAALADMSAFSAGPIFEDYGKTAPVTTDFNIPDRARFKISFDTAKPADAGQINRTLDSAARFINMHAGAGVKPNRMKLAVIIHGKAVHDVSKGDAYQKLHEGAENANAALIEQLLENNVRIIVCGQSAAYYDIDNQDLLPGVEMALSAMTAHALLQQDGYTLNPF